MSLIQPDTYLSRVTRIDVQRDLVDKGIVCVLLDIDNTISRRDTHTVPQDVLDWMDEARAAGIQLCLLSNSWHGRSSVLAEELGLPIILKALKPLPHGYLSAVAQMNRYRPAGAPRITRKNTLMVGDQLWTDVWGAHLVGMKSVLLQPLVAQDIPTTLLLRNVERALLRGRKPEA